MDDKKLEEVTGGYRIVGEDWMPATGTRNLLLDDPCLIWLQFHGKAHGFDQDLESEYSLSDFILAAGRDFESAWIEHEAPIAIQAMRDDRDVRRVQGLLRTIELIEARTPVITHGALWSKRAKIYGAADILCLTSWLYKRFPHLKPAKEEEDHYVCCDLKMSTGLHKAQKAKSLAAYSSQVRLYSYMLGQITGVMPKRAYLVTKDRHDDPLAVEISSKVGKPLDKDLARLRDQFLDIKLNGAKYKPWTNGSVVKPNFNNSLNAPWAHAVEKIGTEYMSGRPLEWLPRVGQDQADALKKLGFNSLDEMLTIDPDLVPLEYVAGIGKGTAKQIRAVLRANRDHKICDVPASIVPPTHKIELFCDMEFFPSLKSNYNDPWPDCLAGRELIFLIGCGWLSDDGDWKYKQVVCESEDVESEKKMFKQFLEFVEERGIFDKNADAVIYHYSPAEVWQSNRAATRTGLSKLRSLPWCDLQKTVLDLPLGIPGAWDFGLKSVAKAISEQAPDFAIKWPTGLSDGGSASVVGWRMYENDKPLETREYELLSKYLEADCHSLERVLSWLRATGKNDLKSKSRQAGGLLEGGGWYSSLRGASVEWDSDHDSRCNVFPPAEDDSGEYGVA